MIDPNDYPLFTKEDSFTVSPKALFRIEDQIFELNGVSVLGSALMLFTGVVAYYEGKEETAYLQCVPIQFYGNSGDLLSRIWGDQALWVEVQADHTTEYVN